MTGPALRPESVRSAQPLGAEFTRCVLFEVGSVRGNENLRHELANQRSVALQAGAACSAEPRAENRARAAT